MAKSLAWGYGLAGAVVAAAIVVVAGTTVGLTEGADESAAPTFRMESQPADSRENVVSSEVVTTATGEQVEYVYVDQPAARGDRDHDDDDDDDDDHERHHDDDDDYEDDD